MEITDAASRSKAGNQFGSDQKKEPGAPTTGEPEAARKNRAIRAREQIIEGLQRQGIPYRDWPDVVRAFYTNPQERQGYSASISPLRFDPPPFDRLNETPEEWAKRADEAWRKHRDDFLKWINTFVALGVDEKIPPRKRTRGSRRKERNAPPDQRANWAARRLMGTPWKEIADDRFHEDQVRKAATDLLKLAGWLASVKPTASAPPPGPPISDSTKRT